MGRKKAEEREVQRRELEQQIKAHTQEMAWEINWRLLCGKKTGTSTEEAQTLWKNYGQNFVWQDRRCGWRKWSLRQFPIQRNTLDLQQI